MADRGRPTLVPVLGAGVLAAALAAVGSSRRLFRVDDVDTSGLSQLGVSFDGGQLPLATTLSMVVLAAWGVVLVTRRRVRHAGAAVGALAALGVLATVVAGWWIVPAAARDDAAAVGLADPSTSPTVWFWVTLLGAVVSAAAAAAGMVLVRTWPEMGGKYDAPTGRRPDGVDHDDDLTLWKAFDEGRDPTA